ncbi:MAG TPA: DnaJ domain-containing protein [Kofleriaceae bacterium]|nr:DnaJ domain-containing protein [Kofleriaceae bacterium]
MSAVPPSIGGLGSTQLKLRASPGFDPLKSKVLPDEYFLFSRFDGSQTLRDVLLESGLPIDRAIQIVMKLRSLGALLLPTETASGPGPDATEKVLIRTSHDTTERLPLRTPDATEKMHVRTAAGSQPQPQAPHLDTTLPEPTSDELMALSENNVLTDVQRRQILAMARLLDKRDPWALLGVSHGADAKTLKRAYFKLSKDIHPDRFYGKSLGSFAARLSTVFEGLNRAYERLTNPDKSGAYALGQPIAETAQSPEEYAAELFERGCALEVAGDALEAMKLFSAAIRLDGQTKYLRRSASCALAAGQPRTALEHAKKAQARSPSDPSLARLLATAFKACGKLADAEEVLVMAMALKSENDVLGGELRNDLAEVRRLLNG